MLVLQSALLLSVLQNDTAYQQQADLSEQAHYF